MDVIANMEKRRSVRTYSTDYPKHELLKKIERIVKKMRKGVFGNTLSFILVDTLGEDQKSLGKMSSYGSIKNGRYYITTTVPGDDRSIIDFGYCFEEMILELTELKLGTCWLGGTFNRGFLAELIKIEENEVIPAITPVGFPADKSHFTDKLIRTLAGSTKRKGFGRLFHSMGEEGVIPLNRDQIDDNLARVFDAVRIAPSASNKQPWRFVHHEGMVHLYWDFGRHYNSVIKGFHIQALDMGIALCHFTKAAEELRVKGNFSYADPKLEKIQWNYILSWKLGYFNLQ